MNFTPIARLFFRNSGKRTDLWTGHSTEIQIAQLRWLLFKGISTEFGRKHGFEEILKSPDPRRLYRECVQADGYERFRHDVMRMTEGEPDILWPGRCDNFAQSSGTSGGRSKYIPVTADSLRVNHFAGSSDVVAQYLRHFPDSRMFAGKGLILGGSFDSALHPSRRNVRIGDLSATLIDAIPAAANLFRVPDKRTALLSDWSVKLDRLAEAALRADLTNISGVPSWFLRVLLRALEISGKDNLKEIWPNLEVFFHGGISFEPYRAEYDRICPAGGMRYFETYNASEGFFATQASRENDGMILLIDRGIFYEFLPLGADSGSATLGVDEVTPGEVYEMIISSCNGLWRYRIGDTVEVVSVDPLKIRVAGRTHSYINAFGEELMESNAEHAIAEASRLTGAHVRNYTAGPLYAHNGEKGCHQWLIEWEAAPANIERFNRCLDESLQKVNSDYAAKRAGDIFLGAPQIITLPAGTFDRWLSAHGSRRLGGQRKIPRLHNDRAMLDALLSLLP